MHFRHIAVLIPLALLLQSCAGLLTWDSSGPEQTVHQAPAAAEPVPERKLEANDHLVRAGDTLYSIAFRNQLDYREVARWNGIGSDYLIYPGQVIRLSPPPPTVTGDIASRPVEVEPSVKPRPITADAPRPDGVKVAPPVVAGGRGGWVWPTEGVVVKGFEPENGSKGLDFTGKVGQPVVAAAAGTVVYSGNALKGYGELVIIKHDDLRLTAYGHNSTRLVKENDTVTAGQQIALMGMGPENRPLLHFEIRERGKPVNPVPFLPIKAQAAPKALP